RRSSDLSLQMPPQQAGVVPLQIVPQEPQFLLSLLVSTQAPLQQDPLEQQVVPQSGVPPEQRHVPPWQVEPPWQTLPQLPQLLLSVLTSLQVPLQQACPEPQLVHMAPPVPQVPLLEPFWQMPLESQQPLGQV